MTRKLVLLVTFCFLAGAVAGCASKGNVTGKVTHKGKPVASGSVTLIASDNLAYGTMISADGTYSIPNVPAGPVKIAVVSPNPGAATRGTAMKGSGIDDASGGPDLAAPAAGGWFEIPEKYADHQSSGLTATVRSPVTMIDLNLE
jgi:hypothetical protein